MGNPYKIQGPACISFSGGRSSGYMLKHILDAHGGSLPEDIQVCFMNTGKEMPETLEFVAACGDKWGVEIHWLEYDPEADGKTKYVDFTTANREGAPFEAIIRKRSYLPNPVTRFCTTELKVWRSKTHMLNMGYEHWDSILGFRADEPRRVAKLKSGVNDAHERWESFAPMAEAGVTKEDVVAWWDEQDFDLELPNHGGVTLAGNCDLCFLKGQSTLLRLMKGRPDLSDWWIRMETIIHKDDGCGMNRATFRADRSSYARMQELALMVEDLPLGGDETIPCFCGD